MRRKCSNCYKHRDVAEFHKRGEHSYQSRCKDCNVKLAQLARRDAANKKHADELRQNKAG